MKTTFSIPRVTNISLPLLQQKMSYKFENINLIRLKFKQFAKLHRRVISHKFPKPKRMR